MISGVSFVSRAVAELMLPDPNVGMISITDPGSQEAVLRPGWQRVLRLQFHDIPRPYVGYVLMSAEQAQQVVPRAAAHAERLGHRLGELPLEHAVHPTHLLLLAQLHSVVGEAGPPLAVLARRVGALVDGALLAVAAIALQEELLVLAPAEPAHGARVASHLAS